MTNLTPLDEFTELIATPDEGEEMTAVTAGAGKGPVRPGFQANANRTAALHALAVNECLVPRFLISADGVDNKIKIHIPGRVPGVDANGKRWMLTGTTSPTVFTPSILGGGATVWPADAIVYVYCYADVTGLMGIEGSTTAPDAGLIFKTGNPLRRYLGCFFTGSGVTPFPLEMSGERGVYRYVAPRVTAALGTDVAYTAVVLTGFLPPHARRILLYLVANGTDGVGENQDIHLKPGPGAGEVIACSAPRSVAGTATTRGYVDLPLIDGTLQYKVSGSSAQAAGLYVAGWTE